MRYRYAVIKFVCASSTGSRSPEKYVTDTYHRYAVIKFVCSLSTVLNTNTLRPKNALPVYDRHPICL